MPIEIVLASASSARAELLRQAGVMFRAEPAAINEDALKRRARERGRAGIECARELAQAKAQAVSKQNPGVLVIGADQILVLDNDWFDKPRDREGARVQLLALRGRAHELATAACGVQQGILRWRAESQPRLTMRLFSDSFLDDYLDAEGDALLGSVGAYRLEGRGVQLFSGITGDYFAVLGLPLIELLAFLRECGALER